MAHTFALVGGLLFLLAFIHFIVDWGFQSHAEAMQKATHWRVRAQHCRDYTLGFALVLWLVLDGWAYVYALFLLWTSHFLIDTYVPVYVWAKYLRKPPEMKSPASELEGFKAFAGTPLGLFLVIAMDQAWHLAFLVPVSLLAVLPQHFTLIGLVGVSALLGLAVITVFGIKKLKTS
jgi:hypothetical protein